MKIKSDFNFLIYKNKIKITLWIPKIAITKKCTAIWMPTTFIPFRADGAWAYDWASAIQILGFGAGIGYKKSGHQLD